MERFAYVPSYSIFLVDDAPFGCYEYGGDGHAADLAAVDADSVTQEWHLP